MTNNIFEIFNPGDRHWRENKDFEKVHVFATKKGGRGPMQVDLDEGSIVLPEQEQPVIAQESGDTGQDEADPKASQQPSEDETEAAQRLAEKRAARKERMARANNKMVRTGQGSTWDRKKRRRRGD